MVSDAFARIALPRLKADLGRDARAEYRLSCRLDSVGFLLDKPLLVLCGAHDSSFSLDDATRARIATNRSLHRRLGSASSSRLQRRPTNCPCSKSSVAPQRSYKTCLGSHNTCWLLNSGLSGTMANRWRH